MGSGLLTSLVISLVLTILLEEIFAVTVGIRDKRDLILIGLVNVVTNPFVVLVYYLAVLYTSISLLLIILLEIIAVFVEALYFKNYGKTFRHPFLFSLSANLFSYGIGKIISIIF